MRSALGCGRKTSEDFLTGAAPRMREACGREQLLQYLTVPGSTGARAENVDIPGAMQRPGSPTCPPLHTVQLNARDGVLAGGEPCCVRVHEIPGKEKYLGV